MSNMSYKNWKIDMYKRAYGGGSFTKNDNIIMQSRIADFEKKKDIDNNAHKYCVHGFSFNGLRCTGPCRTPKRVTVDNTPSSEDVKALNSNTLPNKTILIDPAYQLVADEDAMGQHALEFIIAGLPKLTKNQLQELYEKLYNTYNCRIYK